MLTGAPSDEVLLIERGTVKVVLVAPNGAESIVGLCGPRELGVVRREPRSANVVAVRSGSAVHVPADAFRAVRQPDRAVVLLVNETLDGRLRNADRRQLELAARGRAGEGGCPAAGLGTRPRRAARHERRRARQDPA